MPFLIQKFLVQYTGVEDRLCLVDEYLLAEIEENYCTVPNMGEPEFSAIAERIMQQYSIDQPTTFEESLDLYYTLVTVLDPVFIQS